MEDVHVRKKEKRHRELCSERRKKGRPESEVGWYSHKQRDAKGCQQPPQVGSEAWRFCLREPSQRSNHANASVLNF